MSTSEATEQLAKASFQQGPSDATLPEDPLVAALPPNTDYITYLTLLDYNLNPQNLPTLNRLLTEDDGTLASEIGWDLLKLVLPILRVEPSAAQECLDIIARRGNPREVIVRVSEELERLGRYETDREDEAEGNDELPTFAGEAPRVHLGDMKLAGMPEQPNLVGPDVPKAAIDSDNPDADNDHIPGMADDETVFVGLMSMLSLLHPRIKTKHPSRFLATSLPAALGAYRRLSMGSATTSAILTTLTKLGSRKRPALPPRVSTSEVVQTTALLPDPEAEKGTQDTPDFVAKKESAINQRLLQAVLLEVFDERTTTSSEGHPPITARLRVRHEPSTLLSTRRNELEALESNTQVHDFEDLQLRFLKVAQDLKLDIVGEIARIGSEPEPAHEDDTDDIHEYPTSPSQIPLSEVALLLLYSTSQHAKDAVIDQAVPPGSLLKSLDHVLHGDQSPDDAKVRTSAPTIDSILALLYKMFYTDPKFEKDWDGEKLLLGTMSYLHSLFTSCPDADLRDNAHHISTRIFHGSLSRAAKLQIVSEYIEFTGTPQTPFHTSVAGSVRAVAVDWLRDELFPTQTVHSICGRQTESERYLPFSCLDALSDKLFETKMIEQDPPANEDDEAADMFMSTLPYYIAVVNLLTLVAGRVHGETSDIDGGAILAKAEAFLQRQILWKDWSVGLLSKPQADGTGTGELPFADIFALEDAVGRAVTAVQTDHE